PNPLTPHQSQNPTRISNATTHQATTDIGLALSVSLRIDCSKICAQIAQTITSTDHLQNRICSKGHGCRWLQAQFSLQRWG
ncbi:MAG TPA: hypothetical protein VM656_03295, partial [Pyrinomonadaceae bacterium]|nr:hypothetical protein [Pyrinomonadaceae bacterium]